MDEGDQIWFMRTPKNIDVLFVAGFGPIVRDQVASCKFYSEALGLPIKKDGNGDLHTGGLDTAQDFAPVAVDASSRTLLWHGSIARQSCRATSVDRV